MSAQDGLPPCECVGGGDPHVTCRPCRDFRHLLVDITREEYTTMRDRSERWEKLYGRADLPDGWDMVHTGHGDGEYANCVLLNHPNGGKGFMCEADAWEWFRKQDNPMVIVPKLELDTGRTKLNEAIRLRKEGHYEDSHAWEAWDKMPGGTQS